MSRRLLTTEAVVGAAALTGLVVYCWVMLPWWWALIATGAALWEAWSLIDGVPDNTISEIIWRASDRFSLVPWAGGFLLGLGIGSDYVSDPGIIAPLALLSGNFWFPRLDDKLHDVRQRFAREEQQP